MPLLLLLCVLVACWGLFKLLQFTHSPFSPFCLLPFLLQEYFVEDLGELLLWVGHVR